MRHHLILVAILAVALFASSSEAKDMQANRAVSPKGWLKIERARQMADAAKKNSKTYAEDGKARSKETVNLAVEPVRPRAIKSK